MISFQEYSWKNNKIYKRADFDIALLRLDYPIIDPDTGMGVLDEKRFSMNSIMPICLPQNKYFKDNNRQGVAVGMGIEAEKSTNARCFTDGNGPDAFQQCSPLWVEEKMLNFKDDYEQYEFPFENQPPRFCSKQEPPSTANTLCKEYHNIIEELK